MYRVVSWVGQWDMGKEWGERELAESINTSLMSLPWLPKISTQEGDKVKRIL